MVKVCSFQPKNSNFIISEIYITFTLFTQSILALSMFYLGLDSAVSPVRIHWIYPDEVLNVLYFIGLLRDVFDCSIYLPIVSICFLGLIYRINILVVILYCRNYLWFLAKYRCGDRRGGSAKPSTYLLVSRLSLYITGYIIFNSICSLFLYIHTYVLSIVSKSIYSVFF